MEITDEIKVEEFSAKEEDDIFFTLLNGKTIKEEIKTTRGKFVVKFPKQKDLMLIDKRVALMRGGIPSICFDEAANFAMQKIAFLDVVIESGEEWYNNLKKKKLTWGDMPDTEFIDEVYVLAWSFRSKVQSQLRKNEKKADSQPANGKDVQEVVADDLFSGVAGSAKRTK